MWTSVSYNESDVSTNFAELLEILNEQPAKDFLSRTELSIFWKMNNEKKLKIPNVSLFHFPVGQRSTKSCHTKIKRPKFLMGERNEKKPHREGAF